MSTNKKTNNNKKKESTTTASTSTPIPTSSEGGFQRGSNQEFRTLHNERQQLLKRKERDAENQTEALDIQGDDRRVSMVKKLKKATTIVSNRIKEKGVRSRFDVDDQDNILLDDKQLLRTKKSERFQNPDTLRKKRELKKKQKSSAADHQNNNDNENKRNELSEEQDEEADKLLPFLPKFVRNYSARLYASDIYSGMVVLGAFEMVTDSFIVVSLPFGLRGYVKFNEISDEFTKWSNAVMNDNKTYKSNFQKTDSIVNKIKSMFIKGQLLLTSVIGISDMKKKGLLCTLRPDIINKDSTISNFEEGMNIYGTVQSVQDKGYIISFGKEIEHKGFLKFEDTKFYWPTTPGSNSDASAAIEITLSVGQPLQCHILSISESPKTVHLSVSHFLVSRAVTKDSTAITSQTIKAGMLVEATISAVYNDGLQVRFLEFFAGDIHQFHLDKALTEFQESRTLKARIIVVDHQKKKILLSALPHCLGLRPFPFNTLKIGDTFHEGVMVRAANRNEVLLSLPDEHAKVKALLHLSQTENRDSLKGKVNVGNELHLPCRVKHVDYLDAMVTMTTKKRELAKTIYSYYDLQPGQIHDGTVKFVRDDSIEVKITDNIFGVVPMHNLGEALVLKPRERFNVGQSVRFRILKVIPEKKRLVLSLKPSLIHSPLPILSKKDQCKVGEIAQGFISRIEEERIHVTFFGDVHGIVERSQISRTPITMISDHFQIGQVVTTKTLQVNPKGLYLTLIIDNEDYQQYLKNVNKNNNSINNSSSQEEEEEEEEEEDDEDEQMEDQKDEDEEEDDDDSEEEESEEEEEEEEEEKENIVENKNINNKNNNTKNNNNNNKKSPIPSTPTPSKNNKQSPPQQPTPKQQPKQQQQQQINNNKKTPTKKGDNKNNKNNNNNDNNNIKEMMSQMNPNLMSKILQGVQTK